MREGREYDEAELHKSDRLFSLDEILSESEIEEGDIDEKTLSEEERSSLLQEIHSGLLSEGDRDDLVKECITEIRSKDAEISLDPEEVSKLYLEDGLSLKKIGEHFGFKSGKPIKRILEAAGVDIRPVGFQKIDIDSNEVHRLYFEERRNLKEIAEHFGCKSTSSIHRIFEEQGWKTRYQETYEKEIDPDDVFRLYNEDGLSLREIGAHFGVSIGPIRRIFKEHNMEYSQKIRIDPDVIHHLYFQEGLSKEEVCEHLGVSKKPIDRIFEGQGWEKRPAGFQRVNIDVDAFQRLYYDEELTIQETAERLKVSERTLVRFFQDNQLEARTWPVRIEIDLDEFSKLYYEEELKMSEIAEHFSVSQNTINRFIKERNLEKRSIKSVSEIRDAMFGTDCISCGKPREIIHRKDGKPHGRNKTWTKKSLKTLNPDDWVALCEPCHRLTHSLMTSFGCEWTDIESILKELAKKWLS